MEANEEDIVYHRGLTILSHRDHSVEELRRKLEVRGFPAAAIRATLLRMMGAGLLDDHRFSRAFVRERVERRPMGRSGLLQELRKRGVEEEVAKEAIEAVMREEGVDEAGLARRALGKRRNQGERSSRDLLRRRGFDSRVIREITGSRDLDHEER